MNEVLQRKLYESGRELYKLRFLPCPEECLMDWRGLPRRSREWVRPLGEVKYLAQARRLIKPVWNEVFNAIAPFGEAW